MDATKRIVKILTWVLGLPIFVMTIYNLYRQEINPSALPLISILPDWHWAIWLSILLFILVIRFIFETYWKSPDEPDAKRKNIFTQTSGRDAYQSARDQYITAAPEVVPPNIFVGMAHQDSVSYEKFTLHLNPLPKKPDVEKILDRERTRLLDKAKRKEIETDTALIIVDFNSAEYSSKVENFLEKYKNYEMEKYRLAIIDDRWRTINIVVDSRSILSASNVIVRLYFPEFIHFPPHEINVLRELYRDGNYRPNPPSDPPLTEMFSTQFPWADFESVNTINAPIMPFPRFDRSNEYKIIKTDKGNIVEYRIKDLLQNHPYTDLDPIDIWLENVEQSISFKIPIEINAKELPEKTKRLIEVNIIIEGTDEKEI